MADEETRASDDPTESPEDKDQSRSRRLFIKAAAAATVAAAGASISPPADAQTPPAFLAIARLIQEPKLMAKCEDNCGCNAACTCNDKPSCCEQKCGCDQKSNLKFPNAFELATNPKFIAAVTAFNATQLKTLTDFTALVTGLGSRFERE